MNVLITGGTSGIGKELAIIYGLKGYDLILVSRKENDLEEIKSKVKTKITFYSLDLTCEENVYTLLDFTKDIDIDIFINNAGFGDIGYITNTSTVKQTNMIKLNCICAFILGKEFIKRFIKCNKGHILFVSSAASFGVCAYMAEYYATKAFVTSLAHGYYRELKNMNSNVKVHVLCPGPVKTRFEEASNARFNIKSLSAEKVAKYTVKCMEKNKFEIVPGFSIKLGHLFSHFVPKKMISKLLNKQSEMGDNIEK